MKYFISEEEESIIIQAVELGKQYYAIIRDASNYKGINIDMENRIKVINNFHKRTVE